MSTVEVQPCALCGGGGRATDGTVLCMNVRCVFAMVRLPLDDWNRLSIAMEWTRLLVAADEAHPGFAASVLAAGKAATK
jgi:hypothetical protein